MRVLFCYKKRCDSYGISVGLVNSANFICNHLNSIGINSKVACVRDGNDIDREVTNFQATHVILEALWATPKKFAELLPMHGHKKRNWIVRLHSKFPFLANEGIALDWILGYKHLHKQHKHFFLSCNSREINDDINRLFNFHSIYLPNIYCPEPHLGPWPEIPPKSDDVINIGCFGAVRPLKNQLIQAVAAMEFAHDVDCRVNFHINGERTEQQGDQVLKNLRALFKGSKHALCEHAWTSHPRFVELVRTMDIGMQVSLSETFNIVAADFVANDIPTVGSTEIEWMSYLYKANPTSSQSIRTVLHRAWDSWGSHYLNKLGLWNHNRMAKKMWADNLH